MRRTTGLLSALLLLCGWPAIAFKPPVLIPTYMWPPLNLRASCPMQPQRLGTFSHIPLQRLQTGSMEAMRRRRCGSVTTTCAAASEGRGESKLEKLRKGMKSMGGRMPVTDDDIQRYSALLTDIMEAKEEEVPSVVGSRVQFLLSNDLAKLSSDFRAQRYQVLSPEERQAVDDAESIVLTFLEEFVEQTLDMADGSRMLLREILEASSQGMEALDAKMGFIASGQDPRYTPEFIRFLDAEIQRLGEAANEQQKAKKDGKAAGKKFVSGKSVSLETLADEDEDEDEDEDDDKELPDARTAMMVISMIKARLNAEMEEGLGMDAAPARLLARLLQVDEVPQREMALQSLLSDMKNDMQRAQFYDVVQTTLDDLMDLISEGNGAGVNPELVARLQQIEKSLKWLLKLK